MIRVQGTLEDLLKFKKDKVIGCKKYEMLVDREFCRTNKRAKDSTRIGCGDAYIV